MLKKIVKKLSRSLGVDLKRYNVQTSEAAKMQCLLAYHTFEVEDLAKGIAWVLEDRERYGKLCDRAREKVVQEFSLEVQAKYYLSVYQDIYKFYLCTAR